MPAWLPELVVLADHGGAWDEYLEAIYAFFKADFVDTKPVFRGRELALKRHPVENGKEATFWHMISEGKDEATRVPDMRRCERIRWPKPIIENDGDNEIKVWTNSRGRDNRICIWLEAEEYLVVLADRGTYILPWTAYAVERNHQKRKLQREFEAYVRNNP